jgi:hypothetical protein
MGFNSGFKGLNNQNCGTVPIVAHYLPPLLIGKFSGALVIGRLIPLHIDILPWRVGKQIL